MKNNKFILAFLAGIITYAIMVHTSSCTREDEVVGQIDPPDFEYSSETVKMSEGWTFDKTHSSVMWETDYRGVGALLTGRFNTFGASTEFDADNPENSKLSGYVVLSSVNTGEPGRDAGCLLNTFGTATYDTAKFETTSIEFDNLGAYNGKANLTFHGVTKEVPVKIYYIDSTHIEATNPFFLAGIAAQFEFNAISDFLIESANIADRVRIRINTQYRKAG